jgi:hypothetical protein
MTLLRNTSKHTKTLEPAHLLSSGFGSRPLAVRIDERRSSLLPEIIPAPGKVPLAGLLSAHLPRSVSRRSIRATIAGAFECANAALSLLNMDENGALAKGRNP